MMAVISADKTTLTLSLYHVVFSVKIINLDRPKQIYNPSDYNTYCCS
jgi:hypothetical protein